MDVIFVEVDTQVDFVDPAGALFVPGSTDALPNIHDLLEYATEQRITTISPMCAHVVNDPEFAQFGPHCIEGTAGQRRYFEQLPRLPRRIFRPDATFSPHELRIDPGWHYVVQKRTFPVFANPWMSALRERGAFEGRCAVVFGVATDVCVRTDVLDLRKAGSEVRLVRDAIAGIDAAASERAIEEMVQAGAQLVTTEDVVAVRARPA